MSGVGARSAAVPLADSLELTSSGSRGHSESSSSDDADHPELDEDSPRGIPHSASVIERESKIRGAFTTPEEWIMALGSLLAIAAGIVNVAAFLSLGSFVSHVTGTTTRIGMRLEGLRLTTANRIDGNFTSSLLGDDFKEHEFSMVKSLSGLASFLFGAYLCGLLIPKNQVHFGGRSLYAVALFLNSAMLVVATFIIDEEQYLQQLGTLGINDLAICLTSCATGLQNAMCTMHLAAVVRTTHVTGTVTDIGTTLGRATMIYIRHGCRRRNMGYLDKVEIEVDLTKTGVLSILFFSFLLGCYFGTFLFAKIGKNTFLVPASMTGIMGILKLFFKRKLSKVVKQLEVRRLARDAQRMESVMMHARAVIQRATANNLERSLHSVNEEESDDNDDEMVDLEERLESMAEAMEDMNQDIEDICDDEAEDLRRTPSSSSRTPRREHGASWRR